MVTETLGPKRIGIRRELLPQMSSCAVLTNPKFPPAERQVKEIDQAAHILGLQTEQFTASTESELDGAFQSIAQRNLPALIVATDPFFVARRNDLIALAARHRLPTLYGFRDFAVDGGLMSYGVDLGQVYRDLATYAPRAFSTGRNPVISRYCNQRNLSSCSTLKRQRRSASKCPTSCSRSPTR